MVLIAASTGPSLESSTAAWDEARVVDCAAKSSWSMPKVQGESAVYLGLVTGVTGARGVPRGALEGEPGTASPAGLDDAAAAAAEALPPPVFAAMDGEMFPSVFPSSGIVSE